MGILLEGLVLTGRVLVERAAIYFDTKAVGARYSEYCDAA